MATGPVVEVVGARKFRAACRRAGIDLADLREPHLSAARTATAAAVPKTPRRTGRLASTVRAGGTRTAGVIRAGTAAVPYALPIHWGWPAHGIEPNPWVMEAARESEPQWLPAFVAAMDEAVSTMAAGGL